jgi:hypothetical protein
MSKRAAGAGTLGGDCQPSRWVGIGLSWRSWPVAPPGRPPHLLKLPARRGETGPEPSHPRRSISSPSHALHRKAASGRAICCPSTKAISRRWHSERYPRTWASFSKQCHSPLALRQYSLSVSLGVSSIESEYTQAITKRLIRSPQEEPGGMISLLPFVACLSGPSRSLRPCADVRQFPSRVPSFAPSTCCGIGTEQSIVRSLAG